MISEVITALIIFVATGILGAVGGFIVSMTSTMRAFVEITKAQGRKEIVDAYEHYVVQGHKLTVERYDELLRTYKAYRKLGGNGTAEALWNKFESACSPYIVSD